MKLCIGIPSGDLVQGRFMVSFAHMLMQSKNIEIDFINQRSSRITANRNEIVKWAHKKQATHLLFIDADMTFPPYALQELINHNKDIVGATATKREDGPGEPIGTPLTHSGSVSTERLIKMKWMGLPFMLIKMSVFEKFKKIPFAEPIINDRLVPEDEWFCQQAIEVGYDIWCDLGLSMQMGHLGVKQYTIAPIDGSKPQLVKRVA